MAPQKAGGAPSRWRRSVLPAPGVRESLCWQEHLAFVMEDIPLLCSGHAMIALNTSDWCVPKKGERISDKQYSIKYT